MRILFYSHTGKVSGAEHVLLLLLKLLDRDSVAPVLVCPPGGGLADRARELGVPLAEVEELNARFTLRPDRLISYLFSYLKVIRALRRAVNDDLVDAVHANSVRAGLAAWAAALGTGKPVSWHLHDELKPHPISTAIRGLVACSGKIRLMSVSGATLESFRGRIGTAFPKRMPAHVVHNAVEFGRFAGEADDRQRVRAELGLRDDDFALGIIGQITPRKGQIGLVRAFEAVRREIPRARLFVVGEPMFEHDLEYFARLRAMTSELGLEGSVSFLGRRGDVPALLKAIDTVVINSESEALVLVALEAMTCGTPVVATDVGGTREMIEDGVSGLLVPRGDNGRLAEAIVSLAKDPDLRGKFSQIGKERVIAHFSTERFILGIERFFLQPGRAGRPAETIATAESLLLRDN